MVWWWYVLSGLNRCLFPAPGEQDVIGVGVDTIEIARIESLALRFGQTFLNRVFTAREQVYCEGKRERFACYAARFAAKEAVLKALGTGLSGCRWTDVEVVAHPGGRPSVGLSGGAAAIAGERLISGVLVSLSHDRGRALAFAVAVGEGRR